jgi:hypothetical protein
MNQAEYHLKLVIKLWCGAAPAEYKLDAQLRDVWAMKVLNLDYDTYAVTRLLSQIYQDPLFTTCSAAQGLTPGLFITGGGIQTVNTLLVQLMSCADDTQLSAVMKPFSVAKKLTSAKAATETLKKG